MSFTLNKKKRSLIKLAFSQRGKKGIEFGGPSTVFSLKGIFPVYVFADTVNSVNFASNTVWEGVIKEGYNYEFLSGKSGYQYIGEATNCNSINNGQYDFVISSHCLEHVANPILALKEWHRILRSNGLIVICVPDKRYTFDRLRPYTTFHHLLKDFSDDTPETDTSHFEEITALCTKEADISNLTDNILHRKAHHHVFNFQVLEQMLSYSGFTVFLKKEFQPFHLVVAANKI